jgi:hypothetical protein
MIVSLTISHTLNGQQVSQKVVDHTQAKIKEGTIKDKEITQDVSARELSEVSTSLTPWLVD